MNFSYTDHVGDGSTISFPFSFVGPSPGYLSQSHIKVYVGGVQRTYTLSATNQVTITPAPASGLLVRIRRVVPKNLPYADFSRGNNFTGPLLNNTYLQQLYAYHEFLDGFVEEFPFKLKGPLNVPEITGLGRSTVNGNPVEHSQLQELYETINEYSEDGVLAAALLIGSAIIAGVPSSRLAQTLIQVPYLKAMPVSGMAEGQQYLLAGFYQTLPIHQGVLVWDSSRPKTDHNGVDVFAPEAVTAWSGSQVDLTTLFSWTGTGTGCFVRANIQDGLDPYWAGATGLGFASDTIAFEKCGDACLARNVRMKVSAGTYLGFFLFGRGFAVHCASMQSVIFRYNAAEATTFCVRMHTTGADAFGNDLKDCTIENLSGIISEVDGLRIGETGFTTSCSNPKVERLTIAGFKRNFRIRFCVMGNFSDILSVSGDEGLSIDSEVTCQVINFTNFRSRLNKTGGFARSGIFVTFNTSNFESNINTGLILSTGLTGGPVGWKFNNCDFEDNGTTPDAGLSTILRTQVYIDMNTTSALTKGTGIEFNGGVINSPAGAYDMYAVRAQGVYLNKVSLTSPIEGGFSTSKLGFNSGSLAVKVFMEDCGSIQLRPTTAMYANMPSLFVAPDKETYGYHYSTRVGRKVITNYLQQQGVIETTTVDLTSYDVRGVGTIVADTTSGNLVINSLSNGLSTGQKVAIVKDNPSNTVTIKHNGAGTGKFLLTGATDIVLTGRTGATFEYYNGSWFLV